MSTPSWLHPGQPSPVYSPAALEQVAGAAASTASARSASQAGQGEGEEEDSSPGSDSGRSAASRPIRQQKRAIDADAEESPSQRQRVDAATVQDESMEGKASEDEPGQPGRRVSLGSRSGSDCREAKEELRDGEEDEDGDGDADMEEASQGPRQQPGRTPSVAPSPQSPPRSSQGSQRNTPAASPADSDILPNSVETVRHGVIIRRNVGIAPATDAFYHKVPRGWTNRMDRADVLRPITTTTPRVTTPSWRPYTVLTPAPQTPLAQGGNTDGGSFTAIEIYNLVSVGLLTHGS